MHPTTRWKLAAPLFTIAPASGRLAPAPAASGFPPPPDHWMTIDSLALAVGLSARQQAWVSDPYASLNGVMREAAARRRTVREAMQERLAGRSPQELSETERAELRAEADRSRVALEGYQAEVDLWHGTIRNMLTTPQQANFDALPKPVVLSTVHRGGPLAP